MASRQNPNMPTKQKGMARSARRARSRKVVASRIAKKKTAVVVPELSGKKAKKLVRQQGYAAQRKMEKMMEEGGEVRMMDAPPKARNTTISGEKAAAQTRQANMDVD